MAVNLDATARRPAGRLWCRLPRASSLVYGRLSLAAVDLAKRGDQIIEGFRVLVEQYLAAILGSIPAQAGTSLGRIGMTFRSAPSVIVRT
jgi:hypothetical protein